MFPASDALVELLSSLFPHHLNYDLFFFFSGVSFTLMWRGVPVVGVLYGPSGKQCVIVEQVSGLWPVAMAETVFKDSRCLGWEGLNVPIHLSRVDSQR